MCKIKFLTRFTYYILYIIYKYIFTIYNYKLDLQNIATPPL